MTPEELELAIRDIIRKIYCKEYVGHMRCEPNCSGTGWTVLFGLNNDDRPIAISADLPDKKFLKFIEQELRDRDWDCIHWFTGYQTLDSGCPINNKCEC